MSLILAFSSKLGLKEDIEDIEGTPQRVNV